MDCDDPSIPCDEWKGRPPPAGFTLYDLRDPRHVPDLDRFDIHRKRNRRLAFECRFALRSDPTSIIFHRCC